MDTNKNILFSSFEERLHSFSSHPLPVGHETSSMKLAEAGFERQAQSSSSQSASDEVYCRMCGIKFSGWSGESPWAVHRTISPNCLFLNTPPSKKASQVLLTSTIKSTQNTVMESADTHVKEDKINTSKCSLINLRRQLFPMYDNLALKIEELPEIQHPFQPKRGKFLMLFESLRLLTFENPLSTEAATYAKAGFVYDKYISCAVCIFCNFEVQFTPQERIFLEIYHEEKCSTCPFIRELDVGNISRVDEHLIREKVRNTFLNAYLSGQEEGISYLVKHPEYVQLSSRLDTFKSWPVLLASEFPTELMAECGFYYTNSMDSVRCFSCGIGLHNWSKGADPFAQHAKASPYCWHILQVKGQAYVDVALNLQLTVVVDFKEVQEDSTSEQERAAISSSSPLTPSSSSLSSPSSTVSSPRSVGSPYLDLDSIKAAMACQYTIEQIADAVIKFFVLSNGKYPNEALLVGTLRAADANHKVICDQQEEIIKTHSELSNTKTQLKAKDSVIEATKTELTRTQHTLQWQNIELRTELEQRFVEQNRILQHKDEMLNHKDEMLNHKDEMLNQNQEALQNKDIQLELKNREVEDLQRQLKSMMAALEKDKGDKKGDSVTMDDENEVDRSASVNEDEFPVANCKVCLTNTSQIVFYPCKHVCCCDVCATRLVGKSCPICREPNLTMEKVYII